MKNKQEIGFAGNKGDKVRSDCYVEISDNKGIEVIINSKVKSLYGDSILELLNKMIKFFELDNASVKLDDSGALPFVISARFEAAIKKKYDTSKEYLLEFIKENHYTTAKDRNRITRLYLPGNTPSLMLNAGIHKPDGIILDLEDAVAPDKKFEASFLVRNALRALDFYGVERMVRINQIPKGLGDLEFLIPHNVNLLLIPKCESAEQIRLVNEKIDEIKKKQKLKNNVWLMPIIESSLGVMRALEIAGSADNIVAMAIGLEDYTADLGTKRTNEGTESFFARNMVVNACKAYGLQAIDSVFSDIADMEALKQNVIKSKAIGFDGMGCIHPRQIRVINENFAPDAVEIEKAKKIVMAFNEAEKKGLGVISLGTKMIDPPVVKRAMKVIENAINTGKLVENWMEN